MKNEVILITGASGLIGKLLAYGLLQENYKLVLIDNDFDGMQRLKEKLKQEKILFLISDILIEDSLEKCIDEAHKRFGRIDCAIHAAYPKSKGWGTKFENLKKNFLMEDIQNQLGLAILFSQKIIKYFLKQGYGNLIHFSSIQGISSPKFEHYDGTSMSSPIEYSAIKSGIISITKYLSKYYRDRSLRVNCISPGGIFNNQDKLFVENYKRDCNSKGLLDAEDILGTILFLISRKSHYINGQNIVIDDGWSL
ncbi:short-chain dehydrogenase [Prochlorococcus sp. HOT_208_60]|nr:short-chain dehydrogenase [Prochlorococcus sp. HOT_208_60]